MSTSLKSQINIDEGKYHIQFETDNKKLYEFVELFCHTAMGIDKNPEIINIFNEVSNSFIPESCRNCSNHPSNGGSGFCNCTLGQVLSDLLRDKIMDFNLYQEIKQSLEDAIKFESNEEELLLRHDYCVNHCKNYINCVDIITNKSAYIVKCIHFGALKNKIKEIDNK